MNQIEQNRVISMIKSSDHEMATLGLKLLLRNSPLVVKNFFKRYAAHTLRGTAVRYGVIHGHIWTGSAKPVYNYPELLVRIPYSDLTIFRNIAGEVFMLTPAEVSKYISGTQYTEL